jgi:hypothetical protein
MVEFMIAALPESYVRGIVRSYGFEPEPAGAPVDENWDDRGNDLAWFLAERWALFDRSTHLGAQFNCASTGEGSFLTIFALMAESASRNGSERRVRSDLPQGYWPGPAFRLAWRVMVLCMHEEELRPR